MHVANTQGKPVSWPAYSAAGCAFLFAIPSFYWGFGGKFGAETVGEGATKLSWSTDPIIMVIVLITALLKVAGGLLALSTVQTWGQRFPRWMLLMAGWAGAALLLFYGFIQGLVQTLVTIDVIKVGKDFDWHAFYWHLYLWSPWFVVWGLLLGMTVLKYQRSSRKY